ncbi:outer membrane lipoprotein carrier protein LolA [Marinilabiliaceae bacterium AAT]|uniref:Outer membrane lipoprotein carrier protein LolA n=2 Tax=Plebeiibacterium sediminum TaxID=2992112 RepID=A0AAE3M246_9BACT|nr:outer membrane lipoprotein carrier protein LolA [Plebeiobacterium sediminum]MCW3785556.1 outer membrane lipoprotein carrier protein LolA [Plebeiobacterium sediminum]
MIKRFVLGIFVLLISGIAMAQQDGKPITVEELQKVMKEKTAGVNTISCDFIQDKHMEYLETIITSKGKLFFDTKNRLRWEYKEPFEYLITINNGQFSISTDGETNNYDIESNQMFSKISELIISSVNGTIFTDTNFDVKAFEGENQYVIYLEPNIAELKEVLKKIKMQIAKKDFSVDKVTMYEMDDNYTEISFINKKFNESFSNDIFTAK